MSHSTQYYHRRHLLFVCKPEFGHMVPLLSLAQRLSTYHDITFAVSRIRLEEARNRRIIVDADYGKALAFYALEDGITEPSEHDIPFGQLVQLGVQSTKYVGEFLKTVPIQRDPRTHHSGGIIKPVDAVFCDIMMVAVVKHAFHSVDIPLFGVQSAGAEFMLFYLVMGLYKGPPITEIWTGKGMFLELTSLEGPHQPIPDKLMEVVQSFVKVLPSTAALILNSHREAEKYHIAEIERRAGTEVICCGPLVPALSLKEKNGEGDNLIQWLNTQKPASVIYIGFGSLVTPEPEQLKEIAKALMTLKKPFIWSLKPAFHQYLPEDLLMTEGSLGKVCSWVPQQEVLMNASVGLALHHGGWGATQQTLIAGKPALVWPMASDERMAGKYLVEKKAALMMEGTGIIAERLVLAEEIAQALDEVQMTCQKRAEMWGQKLRQALLEGGTSQKELEQLLHIINERCSF